MKCPYCAHEESKVLDSRPVEDGASIRRRRECLRCGRRFTTYERMDHVPVMVVKRDGRREPFDRGKIMKGIMLACGKRPISMEDLERVVTEVEREVLNRGEHEVSSLQIGALVMERLRRLDDVAYVRFASEHRRFRDVDMLVEEAETLKERKRREEELRDQVPLLAVDSRQTKTAQ
ncbi:MAG TPA: transcriptional regulator NrdR [bacterium]